MTLHEALADYLRLRRRLGFEMPQDGRLLEGFVEFLERAGAERITTELALAWARMPAGTHPHYWRQRLSVVRGFARHLATIDPESEVPSKDLSPAHRPRIAPYIYTEQEIAALMAAAGRLRPPLRAARHQTLIGLLAVTGMRPGEALALDRQDVDLRHGVVHVRAGKQKKQREVPLHPSTVRALRNYARLRDARFPEPSTPAFFIGARGRRVPRGELNRTFTLAAYRDAFRLLLRFAHERTGKQPFELDIDDLDAPLIGAFLKHLEEDRGNSPRTRNARLKAAWTARRWPSQRARDRANGLPSYRMIRFADDFVVLVRGTEAQAHAIKEQTAEFMAEQMRLTLSPEKTAITHVDDGFDLLGFRIVRRSWRGTKRVAITFPSQRALREVMHRIKTLTTRSTTNLSLDQLIHVLNPILRGWTNYHRHAASSRCFAYLSHYLWWRVIRWLRKKYERLTWKQIRRRCWGHHGTSREGTRLAWPDEVPVTRYRYRGHNIPFAVGGHRNRPSHHSTGNRRCVISITIGHRVLWRAGCSGMGMSGCMSGEWLCGTGAVEPCAQDLDGLAGQRRGASLPAFPKTRM